MAGGVEEGLVARTARKKLGVGANERERRKKERRKERKKRGLVVCARAVVYISVPGYSNGNACTNGGRLGQGGRERERERKREKEREEGRGGRSLNIKVSTERASHV